MARTVAFNRNRQTLAVRLERYTDVGQEWILQLVLVAAIVTAVIQSLNG